MDLSTITPTTSGDETLRLRHKLHKLQWMGLDREAEQLARKIDELEGDGPTVVAPLSLDTD